MSVETGRAPTDHASRYLQRLAKHWAHRNEVTFDPEQADIALRGNRVQMRAEPDELVVTLITKPEGDATRLRSVFEEHINRFAFREGALSFDWKPQ